MNPIAVILLIIAGILIGSGIGYFIFVKTIKIPQVKLNKEVENTNQELVAYNIQLLEQKTEILDDLAEASQTLQDKYKEIRNASFQVDEVKEQAKAAKEEFLKNNLEIAQNELDNQLTLASERYQAAEDEYLKEYLSTMADMVQEAEKTIKAKNIECQVVEGRLAQLNTEFREVQEKITATIAAQKRAAAEKEKQDFYRLMLESDDIREIALLREVTSRIREPIALYKAIWKVYYEKPYLALIGRVLGADKKTGIYKITNINNGMSYVGQAVDVAERWKQHIKRGMGAETPTRNKLYPAMMKEGVENFTFELLVECSKEELNEQEDKYQEIFHCKDYGYSIK